MSSGATTFSSCNAITSGTDISTNNCVTDSHRYAQYLITLGTSASASTPTFTSFSIFLLIALQFIASNAKSLKSPDLINYCIYFKSRLR